jgi:hypothetical protein
LFDDCLSKLTKKRQRGKPLPVGNRDDQRSDRATNAKPESNPNPPMSSRRIRLVCRSSRSGTSLGIIHPVIAPKVRFAKMSVNLYVETISLMVTLVFIALFLTRVKLTIIDAITQAMKSIHLLDSELNVGFILFPL